jgi:multidrug transporter EmrE-like cation transporter
MVFLCTVCGAAAQVLIKTGANHLQSPGLLGALLAAMTNLPLMAGYSLYALSTALLVLALREGELSILYPVIALTYVWVTGLSVLIFHESMNGFKLSGLSLIVAGVTVLGRGSRR